MSTFMLIQGLHYETRKRQAERGGGIRTRCDQNFPGIEHARQLGGIDVVRVEEHLAWRQRHEA